MTRPRADVLCRSLPISIASSQELNVKNAMHPKGKIEATFYATAIDKLERRKETVDVIVELRDDGIQASVRAMRIEGHDENVDDYVNAFEKREYEKLIQEFMGSVSLHSGALVQAYQQLPLLRIKLKWADELDVLNRDRRVKAIYENFVLKSGSRGTRQQ